jgi:hypothetical protein
MEQEHFAAQETKAALDAENKKKKEERRVAAAAKEARDTAWSNKWTTRAKIMVATYQIVLQVPSTFQITLGPVFTTMKDNLAFLNFDVVKMIPVACVSSGKAYTYIESMMATTIIPIALVGVLVFVYFIVRICTKIRYEHRRTTNHVSKHTSTLPWTSVKPHNDMEEEEQADKAATDIPKDLDLEAKLERKSAEMRVLFFKTVAMLCYCILPAEATKIFKTFLCADYDPNNETGQPQNFLVADLAINCSSQRYKTGRAWAYLMTIVYPIGLPCAILLLLYWNRKTIRTRAEGFVAKKNATKLIDGVGFLYLSYKPEFFYFEMVEASRRLSLTAVVSIFKPGSKPQMVRF